MNGRETHLPPLHPVRADDAAHSPAATGSKDKSLRTHRKKDEVWQVICIRWNFSFGFSPLLTMVTMSDYAKHDVLASLLSHVRRWYFIQSYTVTPIERGKNLGVKDEIPWQRQLPQEPGTQHTRQRQVLLCKVFTCCNQTKSCEPCAREVTQRLHLERLKQNFSVPCSEERSPFDLWVKLLAAQCQADSAAIQVRRWNSLGLPGVESESTHPLQSFPWVCISHSIFFLASVIQVTTGEQLLIWLVHDNKMLFIRSDVGRSLKAFYKKQLHDFMKTEKLKA